MVHPRFLVVVGLDDPLVGLMAHHAVVVTVCIRSHVTSTIEQQYLQPSEAVISHPPVWSVGRC